MIIDRIYQWARLEPLKAALIHNDTVIDYATLAKAIEAFRKFLERHDLPPETIAVVLVRHLADSWALLLALRSLGLTTIHVRSLAQAKALGIKNVSCVVTTVPEQSTHDLADNLLINAKLIVVSSSDLGALQLHNLPLSPTRNRACGGHILYTSGTTGAFKKLMWDSGREDVRVAERSRMHCLDRTTVAHTHAIGPHCAPGWRIPLSVWQAGGCVVFDQRPERYEKFFRHAITIAFLNPSPLQKIVDANNSKPDGCEIFFTSGLVGSAIIARAIEKFGRCLSNSYGVTELVTPPLISRFQSVDEARWLYPTANRTVQIVDEDGHECPSGQEGVLRILTTELDWQCYLDDEEETSKVFRDGFFYPGDRAVKRGDGRIRIVGRASDVLNVRGNKMAVGPIEQQIQTFLEVEEVCVFSGLNIAGQNELIIAIECDNEPPKERLDSISHEFSRFGFDKVRFSILREFPRAEAGAEKVRRVELRKLVFS